MALRAALWRLSTLSRVRKCGKVPTGVGFVGVRLSNGVAGFAGVQTCGSVWADPVCSAKVLARRAVEVGGALGQAEALGYGLGFATFTMRHRRGQSLADLWDAAGKGWARATSGNAWVRAVKAHGVVGWVRVWEVTHGANGWHVHVHVVFVLDHGDELDERLDALCSGVFGRWSRGLQAAGLEAPLRRGQEWHIVTGEAVAPSIAEYLTKLQGAAGGAALGSEALGLELTHVRPGRSRSALATAPVWSVLEAAIDGEAWAVRAWAEWEAGSKGRRQIGWSVGLRRRLALPEEERTDADVAREELGTADDTLVMITPKGWRALIDTPERLPQVLNAAERGGLTLLRSLLDAWGDVPYLIPDRC